MNLQDEKSRLQQSFLAGTRPTGLNGFYRGQLVKFFPTSTLFYIAGQVAKIWLPWYGKEFNPEKQRGHNILPAYLSGFIRSRYGDQVIVGKGNNTLKVFPFRTNIAKSLKDNLKVLQLDYNLAENPQLVRDVIDELVCVGENNYLGKAYLKKDNNFRLVAYFSLMK